MAEQATEDLNEEQAFDDLKKYPEPALDALRAKKE